MHGHPDSTAPLLRCSRRCTLRHEIGIAHGIQPEEGREHPGRQESPGHDSGYAAQEEHHPLHYLPVVELSKAADEGQESGKPGA